ncbi:Tripeptidyl-peptidase sed2 [Ophidiomyces ophidiicola]|nr:Tripeptidyl-peptidase sed2 [Ophidiomyces ophidiicola]
MLSFGLLLSVAHLLFGLEAVIASPANGFKLAERLPTIPDGWTQGDRADAASLVHLKLSVRAKNPELLHRTLLEISTPGSRRYGQHMKRDEVQAMVAPDPKASDGLVAWLREGGVKVENIDNRGDWIDFSTTVDKAERLLNTQFYHFMDKSNKARKIRSLEYSLPSGISRHVRTVQPTTFFGQMEHHRSHILRPIKSMSDFASSAALNTPATLRQLYSMQGFKVTNKTRNLLGVSGYLDQYARYSDLNTFIQRYAPEAKGATFSVELLNGGKNDQNSRQDSVEASLDIQYAVSLAYNTSVTYYSAGGRGPLVPDNEQPDPKDNQNEPYMEQLKYFASLPDDKIPTVLSTSYGENEQSVPKEYAKSVCDEFAKLGARGVSVIFSSGDSGVGAGCQTNDGQKRARFNPIFPAACPYVTSVGATESTSPEKAVSFSSGGFSDVFQRPTYQNQAVSAFLSQLGDKFSQYFNRNGRGFPDVAAQGVDYAVYDHGRVRPVGGTSASAPTIAAIISNLNEVRLSQGKPVLGFLNPWLYSKGHQGFTDIVNGAGTGCNGAHGGPRIPGAAWNAVRGWDPVTGFGTPNFKKLMALLPASTPATPRCYCSSHFCPYKPYSYYVDIELAMVSFWPWRGPDNSPASFEKALSQLSKRLAETNSHLDRLRQRSRRFKALWTLYTTFIYILYSVILVLVLGRERWGPLEYTGLCGGPVLYVFLQWSFQASSVANLPSIYLVRAAAASFYSYRISKSQAVLDDLQKQRNDTIEKLKEATKYNSTQQLLEKYGGAPATLQRANEDADTVEGPNGKKRRDLERQASPHPPSNRTGLPPPPTANIPRLSSPASTPQPPPDRPQTSGGIASHPLPQITPLDEPGFHPNAFPTSFYSESRQPKWYDRVLDVLLGEDETLPKNRVVLICQQCRLVNGQAPPGVRTEEELGAWRCGSCGAWNNQIDKSQKLATDTLPNPSPLSNDSQTRSKSVPDNLGQIVAAVESLNSVDEPSHVPPETVLSAEGEDR